MKVVYEKAAIKVLRKMPRKLAELIMSKVTTFAVNGRDANIDVVPLKGTDLGFRIRQGDWRILLHKTEETIVVVNIKPRGDAYK